MLAEALLYIDLLVFLAGTLLYGYLARELVFRPGVLPGNWALRALPICLLVFYGGTLIDMQMFLLLGPKLWSVAGVALDGVRGVAWLLAFPLLAEILANSLARQGRPVPRWARLAAWSGLLPLVVPAIDFVRAGQPVLGEATRDAYPWIVLHSCLALLVAAVLSGRLVPRLASEKAMVRLLRGLQALLVGLLLFFVATLAVDPWGSPRPASHGLQLGVRTSMMASLLLPGLLFAVFVRRYNVLRLSLSFRTLRHFVGVLALVILVMAAGPALGVGDFEVYRRLVAWGLFLALFVGVLYAPVADALLRRSPALRQFFGRSISAPRLEALMDRLQTLDLDAAEIPPVVADELGTWLSVKARFLDRPNTEPRTAPFWRHFEKQSRGAAEIERHGRAPIHRLAPGPLAVPLARSELQAVFPLFVAGELEGLLGLSDADASPWGGGLDDGELEVVALVLRQLSALLATRRSLEARLVEERRLAEQERLGLLGLVAASLAHEVKNPLSSMKVLSQALREDLSARDGHDDGVQDLDAIVEQIDRLDHTTREILGLARPEPGDDCDLRASVESAVYILGAEARRRGVDLVSEIDDAPALSRVPGSPGSWQTVIFNLVLNAVRHTAPGTVVKVKLLHLLEGGIGRLVFTTANPAPELTAEELERVFEPFVSNSAAPAAAAREVGPDPGGTGLGLALVRRRVRELGARVAAELVEGEAHFRIELPLDGGRVELSLDETRIEPSLDDRISPEEESP